MGIEGERVRQKRDLNELAQSSETTYFRAAFKAIPGRSGEFIAQFKIGDDGDMAQKQLMMPSIGTKALVHIDPHSPWQANRSTAVRFNGSVVADIFGENSVFVCMLRGPASVFNRLKLDEYYPVSVAYVNDRVPFERQMVAIEQLSSIDPKQKPDGVDVLQLFFNDNTLAPKPAAFKELLAKDHKDIAFTTFVHNMPAGQRPNERQMEAIMDVVNSDSGLTLIQGPPGTGKTNATNVIALGLTQVAGIKLMVCAPQNEATANCHDAFIASQKKLNLLSDLEFVHFTGATVKMTDAQRILEQQNLEADNPELSSEDVNFMLDADNLALQFARMSISRNIATNAMWTFGRKLAEQAKIWANIEEFDSSKDNDWLQQARVAARQYFKLMEELPTIADRRMRKLVQTDIETYEWNLGYLYLKHVVRVVFCTLSTSAHPLLTAAFNFQELIIDEAAHESLGGLATVFGAYAGKMLHVTLSGDHKQGAGVYAAADSSIGHFMYSRNLFQEIAETPYKTHKVIQLVECFRMLPELVEFHKQFYTDELTPTADSEYIEIELQATTRAFWDAHVRDSMTGPRAQICIDTTGYGTKMAKASGSTTRYNNAEAKIISWTIKRMLEFAPPAGGRKILPKDIGVVSGYTGQVLEIRNELRKLGVDPTLILVATTNHAQGKQRPLIFFSVVINTGEVRPKSKELVPIRFVADPQNINVSLSRQRIGRYIVGGLQCLVQMASDGHRDSQKAWPLFGLLKDLAEKDCIITGEEWAYTMDNDGKKAIAPAKNFSNKIKKAYGSSDGPSSHTSSRTLSLNYPAPASQIGVENNPFDFHTESGATNTHIRPEPANASFPGLADADRGGRGGRGGNRGGNRGKSRQHHDSSSGRAFTVEQKAAVIRIKRCAPTAYYEILGLEATKAIASDSDIKKAYRKLSLLTHPDKNGYEGADEAFKLVSKAF
ncbi:Chaperone protein dnaJ [Pleosporales sp. CAS-2024a]